MNLTERRFESACDSERAYLIPESIENVSKRRLLFAKPEMKSG
jgi:hypothetical protein